MTETAVSGLAAMSLIAMIVIVDMALSKLLINQ